MPQELERRRLPQTSDTGITLEPALPTSPQKVFALVVDYTSMTMEELENIRTLIGGGNGPVVKLAPSLLLSQETSREAILQLGRTLLSYPCNMLFLLVPWGMSNVDMVIEVMTRVGRQRPFVVFAIGRIAYSVELAMTIDPISEGDAELRQSWTGYDLAGVIAQLEEMRGG